MKLTSGTTICSVSVSSMSGALEKLRFPVLAMNCGCAEAVLARAIFSTLYFTTTVTKEKKLPSW